MSKLSAIDVPTEKPFLVWRGGILVGAVGGFPDVKVDGLKIIIQDTFCLHACVFVLAKEMAVAFSVRNALHKIEVCVAHVSYVINAFLKRFEAVSIPHVPLVKYFCCGNFHVFLYSILFFLVATITCFRKPIDLFFYGDGAHGNLKTKGVFFPMRVCVSSTCHPRGRSLIIAVNSIVQGIILKWPRGYILEYGFGWEA